MRKVWTAFAPQKLVIALLLLCSIKAQAQMDNDAIMMAKNVFCGGIMYSNSSWTNYWEGDFKRNNLNLGKVSTQMVGFMGTYGISRKLNVLVGLPYVFTKASAGTLSGLKGLQDASLWLKWQPVKTRLGEGTLSLFTIGGFSFPTTNYVADYLPLSIGMHSKNLSVRGMVDYQKGKWFATGAATYVVRSNIKIDRDAYYTTGMHNTNNVAMPDAMQFDFRTGYRTNRVVAEAILNNWTTLNGFDITRNNMPFPSNKMVATTAGVNMKYEFNAPKGLTLYGGGNYTLAGRNVGQATSYHAGIFYILNFSRQKTSSDTAPLKN